MNLQEMKDDLLMTLQVHLHSMRDVIQDPSLLRIMGYSNLESYLKKEVLHLCEVNERKIRKWEKENPL